MDKAFIDAYDKSPKNLAIIKAIIDLGWTVNSRMILTGSDRILLEDGAKGFPGVNRRGVSGRDIQLFPLKFKEFINLL